MFRQKHSHWLRFVPRRPHWPLTKFKQQKSYTPWRARISPSLHRVEEPFLEAFKLLEKRYDSGMTMTGYEKIRMIATALVWREWNVPSSNTQCKRNQYMSININIIRRPLGKGERAWELWCQMRSNGASNLWIRMVWARNLLGFAVRQRFWKPIQLHCSWSAFRMV